MRVALDRTDLFANLLFVYGCFITTANFFILGVMKNKLFLFVLLFVSVAAVSCSSDKDDPLRLSKDKVEVRVVDGASVRIYGGSGGYSVGVADAAIADAGLGYDYDETQLLHITPKKTGETKVTVSDSNGETVYLDLTVISARRTCIFWRAEAVAEAADMQVAEEIEEDVLDNMPLPEGYCYALTYTSVKGGNLAVKETPSAELDIFSGSFTKEGDVFTFIYNDDTFVYDVDIRVAGSRLNVLPVEYEAVFTENLTEYYKNKYPDAGVTGVKGIQICQFL